MGRLKQKCDGLLNDSVTPAGRRFDLCIQALIIVSIITFSIETLPNLSGRLRNALSVVELAIVAIFTVEYLARIWVAKKPLKFVFSFYGLIDLLAILPFYLALGFDARSVRAFRLLRLFRLFKLFRYTKTLDRFSRAFAIAREELIIFGIVTIVLIYLSAVGIYHFENAAQPNEFKSVFHCLWWAVTTLTTVGYGDVYPITLGGRLFTFIILMLGLGIVTFPAGVIATALSKARAMEREEAATESKESSHTTESKEAIDEHPNE